MAQRTLRQILGTHYEQLWCKLECSGVWVPSVIYDQLDRWWFCMLEYEFEAQTWYLGTWGPSGCSWPFPRFSTTLFSRFEWAQMTDLSRYEIYATVFLVRNFRSLPQPYPAGYRVISIRWHTFTPSNMPSQEFTDIVSFTSQLWSPSANRRPPRCRTSPNVLETRNC